jgi:hypothetical protein
MGAIWYTNKPQPKYLNRLHDICQMQDKWNKHMANKDFSLWWDCLEKSMQICLNTYVPGWMVVPQKPHPSGNEYHTICDGEFGLGNPIMWHVELQEGKDWLAKAGPKKWSNLGKMVHPMLRIHKVINSTSGKGMYNGQWFWHVNGNCGVGGTVGSLWASVDQAAREELANGCAGSPDQQVLPQQATRLLQNIAG